MPKDVDRCPMLCYLMGRIAKILSGKKKTISARITNKGKTAKSKTAVINPNELSSIFSV